LRWARPTRPKQGDVVELRSSLVYMEFEGQEEKTTTNEPFRAIL
jgi:hypothetical protein